MKTVNVSVIIIVGISLIPFFVVPSFEAGNTGDPVEIIQYQLSQVVASQNNVYVTYQENPQNSGNYHVFFRNSFDNGETFGKILELDNPDHLGSNPLLAASGNNVYVSWTDQKDYASPSQVLFARSTDGGNTFSSPVVLSNNTENSGVQQIFASGNNVYLLMIDELKGNTILRLSFRASHDNGIAFGNPITLLEDTMTRGSIIMSLSGDGKTIYAVGEESKNCPIDTMNCSYDIFLKKSTDYGESFGESVVVKKADQEVQYIHMATSENNVYLVWGENATVIGFVKSNDGGETFNPPVDLTPNNAVGESIEPRIASYANNVYVTWENNAYNHPSGLFFTRSTDGGNSFSVPTNLTGDIVNVFSDMISSNNNVYITWTNHTTDKWDVFFTKSNDNGTTFDKIHNLTGEIKYSFNVPQVVSDGNNAYIAFGTSYPGNDIMFVKSNNNGNNFENIINLNHYGTAKSPKDLIHITSPLEQFKSGIFAKDTSCNPYLALIFKEEDGTPACVNPQSVEELIKRGWAMPTEDPKITHINLQVFSSYGGLENDFLKGNLNSIAGPIANTDVMISVNGTIIGTTRTDPGGCFQFDQWDEQKLSKQISEFAELDKTRIVHVPAVLQFDARYSGDENHNSTSSTAYSYLYLYAVPLAPSQYDTSVLPQEVNVSKSFGIAQIQVSVKTTTFKDSEVSHMKLYLDRLPCGMENYEIKRISDNDTASLTHPAIFNFTMYPGAFTPPGRYSILISQNPSSLGESDLDVGGFILNVLAGN